MLRSSFVLRNNRDSPRLIQRRLDVQDDIGPGRVLLGVM